MRKKCHRQTLLLTQANPFLQHPENNTTRLNTGLIKMFFAIFKLTGTGGASTCMWCCKRYGQRGIPAPVYSHWIGLDMSVTDLPVVDEVGVERLGCAYRGGAVAPGRVKQHRASVSRADDQRIRTAVLEVPRPRVRTVRAQLRSASRRCVAARLLADIVHHDDTFTPSLPHHSPGHCTLQTARLFVGLVYLFPMPKY